MKAQEHFYHRLSFREPYTAKPMTDTGFGHVKYLWTRAVLQEMLSKDNTIVHINVTLS